MLNRVYMSMLNRVSVHGMSKVKVSSVSANTMLRGAIQCIASSRLVCDGGSIKTVEAVASGCTKTCSQCKLEHSLSFEKNLVSLLLLHGYVRSHEIFRMCLVPLEQSTVMVC